MSELPKSWHEVEIGEVADVIGGGTPKASDLSNFADPGTAIAWLTPADLSKYTKKEIAYGKRDLSPKGLEISSAKLIPKGSLLFSSRAPIGYVAVASNEISTNQGFKSFVFTKHIDSSYAYYYMKSIRSLAEERGTGTTFKELSGAAAKKLPFIVAPLNEQTRIANKLDSLLVKVDTAQIRLEKIPTLLKRFRQSVLAAATSGELTREWRGNIQTNIANEINELVKKKEALISTKIVKKDLVFVASKDIEVPDTWSVVNLGGLASKVTDGEHKTPERESEGRYLISARNVRDGAISLAKVDYVGEEEFKKLRKRCDPDKGDILISCSGSVGRIALCDKDNEYVMVRSAALVKTDLMSQNNTYLMYALQSPVLQQIIIEKSKSTAQANLFLAPIKELPVPFPPMKEQKEIVRRVESLFTLADTVEKQYQAAKQRVDRLSQSILAKAFRGELVPQDPNDEPASVLLDRIRAIKTEMVKVGKQKKTIFSKRDVMSKRKKNA